MAGFPDIQYFIHADIVGGSENVQKFSEIVYEWFLMKTIGLKDIDNP